MMQFFYILILLHYANAKKNQIGHIPTKGNLWRAKQRDEIGGNLSESFRQFAATCQTTISEETGITYYYSTNSTFYEEMETDDSVCAYSLERSVPSGPSGESSESEVFYISNFTLYFQCDATCCAMECCKRDIEMTIIGSILIGVSLLILIFYVTVYFAGLVCAWRNGSLGRRHHSPMPSAPPPTVSARPSNGNAAQTADPAATSLIVIKNGHCDTC